MNIKKIKLVNFRNYKNVEINFSSDDPNKKITVILGNNTFGKTTLVKAFLWCFYGDITFKTKEILNHDVESMMRPGDQKKVEVDVEFVHKGKRYNIMTSEEFVCKKNQKGERDVVSLGRDTKMLVVENGLSNTYGPEATLSEINNILSKELKDYFFFDGESNKIEELTKRRNLKDAINNLLDVQKLLDIQDYYSPQKTESVISTLYEKLNKNGDIQSSLNQYNDGLNSAQAAYDESDRKIKEADAQIDALNEEQREINQKLEESSSTRSLQAEREAKINERDSLLDDVQQNFADSLRIFSGDSNSDNSEFLNLLFAHSFNHSNIRETLDNTSFSSEESYSDITEKAVDALIERGVCICGAEIKSGSDAYKHLQYAKQHMEPHDYSSYVKRFREAEEYNAPKCKGSISSITSTITKIANDANRIEECNNRIEEIGREIKSGDTDFSKIEARRSEIDRNIGRLTSDIEYEKNQLTKYEAEIADYEQRIRDSAGKLVKNKRYLTCIDYAQKILDTAMNQIEKANSMIFEDLQNKVQKALDSIYSNPGEREVFISDDFSVKTRLADGKFLDGSNGLDTVTNFSFVIGLMNLAKVAAETHRYTGSFGGAQEQNATPEIYPLVLDAIFSNTDEIHIQNICQALLQNCDQVIICVMEKDFKYAEKAISDGIAHKYQIEKLSATEAQIKEVM